MAPRTPKDPQTKPAKAEKPAKAKPDAVKPQAAKPEKAKPQPAKSAVAPVETAVVPGGQVKLKDLIESVASKTGGKKPEVKAVVEATLAALGEALGHGQGADGAALGQTARGQEQGPGADPEAAVATDGAKAAGLALADDGEDG